ncbi:MAG: hypothetical protein AAGD01_03750 [Acidobacteriota bacterium]
MMKILRLSTLDAARPSLLGLAVLGLAVLGLVVPADSVSAAEFTVTLKNGAKITSHKQPYESSWDENVIMVITETGNWIGLHKEGIESLRARIEEQGFGMILDEKTVQIGFLPNDAPTDEELAEAEANRDPTERLLEAFQQSQSLAAPEEPNYSVNQFVDPDDTTALPSTFGDEF